MSSHQSQSKPGATVSSLMLFLLCLQLTPSLSSPPLDTWLIRPSLCRSFPSAAELQPCTSLSSTPWGCRAKPFLRAVLQAARGDLRFQAGSFVVRLLSWTEVKISSKNWKYIFHLYSKWSTEDFVFNFPFQRTQTFTFFLFVLVVSNGRAE